MHTLQFTLFKEGRLLIQAGAAALLRNGFVKQF